MTLEELQAAAARVPELERRLEQLEGKVAGAPSDEDLLTMKEASEISGFSEKTIKARIRDGKLVGFQPDGSNEYRVRRGDLLAWLKRRVQPRATEATVEDEAARILGEPIPFKRSGSR